MFQNPNSGSQRLLQKTDYQIVGRLPVTRETFYIPAEDRSFGLYSLYDRYDICKVANIGHLLSNGIGKMMKRYISAIVHDRRITQINTIEEMEELLF
jgi:hypothetical protein